MLLGNGFGTGTTIQAALVKNGFNSRCFFDTSYIRPNGFTGLKAAKSNREFYQINNN
jgi:hypothetical protein